MAGTVKVTFIGDSANLKKHLQEVTKQMEATETGISRFGSKMSSVGKSMVDFGAKMTVGVTLPLALVGKKSFEAASDMQESMSKVGVVFGKNSKEIVAWSKTAATEMGLSQQKAIEAAGTFGNLFKAFGVGDKESQKMSQGLVKMAADLASFNNTDVDTALLALKSGISGESEPLKQFGIALNEDRIKAEALSAGLVKGAVNTAKVEKANLAVADATLQASKMTKRYGADSEEARKANNKLELAKQSLSKAMEGESVKLDAATKSQAIYNLIKKDGKLAEDDFKETSKGAAGQLKIMKARMEDSAAVAGQTLIPIVTDLAEWVGKAAGKFSNLSSGTKKMIVSAGLIAAAIGPLTTLFGGLAKGVGGSIKAIQASIKAVQGLTYFAKSSPYLLKIAKGFVQMKLETVRATAATVTQTIVTKAQAVAAKAAAIATKAWGAAMAFVTSPIGIIIIAIAAFIAIMVVLYKKNDAFRKFIDKTWKQIANAALWAWENVIKPVWNALVIYITKILIPYFNLLWKVAKKVFEIIANVVEWVWTNRIKPVWTALVWYVTNVLVPYFKFLWAVLKEVWDAISKVISWAWDNVIKPVWNALWTYITEILMPIWGKIWDAVKWVWDQICKFIQTAWDTMKPIFQAIWDWITNTLIPVFQAIWDGIKKGWDAVASTFSDVYDKVVEMWDKIQQKAQSLPKWLRNLFGIQDAKIEITGGEKFNNAVKGANNGTASGRANPLGQVVPGFTPQALGGPVMAGMPYKVGEGGGPEMFIPSTDGHIVNARQTRSMGSTYNVNVYPQKADFSDRDLLTTLKRFESLHAA